MSQGHIRFYGMGCRINFRWGSFDWSLVPFIRVKSDLSATPPPEPISSENQHPIRICRHLFCSALFKSPVIMPLGMSPPWLKGDPAYLALRNVAWLLDCTLWHAQEILLLAKSYQKKWKCWPSCWPYRSSGTLVGRWALRTDN
jgi:hypothetical protein